MKPLIFFARITLIYNLCMIVTFLMRYADFMAEGSIKSTIVISGYILAFFCNGLTALWYLVLILTGIKPAAIQPSWMFITNFLCFIFQLYLLNR